MDVQFNFTDPPDDVHRLGDILETASDKYRLNETQLSSFAAHIEKQQAKGNGFGAQLVTPEEQAPTITTSVYNHVLVDEKYYCSERFIETTRAGHARGSHFNRQFVTPEELATTLMCNNHGRENLLIESFDKGVDEKYYCSDQLIENVRAGQERGSWCSHQFVNANDVAATLTKSQRLANLLTDPVTQRIRRLTPRECARLMGFPDDFKIVCSDNQAYMQFGNAVVVPVVQAIGEQMLEALMK